MAVFLPPAPPERSRRRNEAHHPPILGSGARPAPLGRRQYILLSHVLGRALVSGHIAHRVHLERAMAALLGLGLFAPLHAKTLKKILQVTALDSHALSFLVLLRQHAAALLQGRCVVLVLDDLPGLSFADLPQVVQVVDALFRHGVRVLLKRPDGCLILLDRTLQPLASVWRELTTLRHHQTVQDRTPWLQPRTTNAPSRVSAELAEPPKPPFL